MEAIWNFIVENWKIVSENWQLFVTFAILCFGASTAVLKWLYDHILYKDLPDKKELQKENEELTSENRRLKEELRSLKSEAVFIGGIKKTSQVPSVGDRILETLVEK